jgi:CHASE3 domain sensor protein
MSDKIKTKFKFKVLSSFVLTEEKKAEILGKLDSLSDEQIQAIQEAITSTEEEATPFLDAAFASPKGKEFTKQLDQIYTKLKKDTRKQEEKEDRAAEEEGALKETIQELDNLNAD